MATAMVVWGGLWLAGCSLPGQAPQADAAEAASPVPIPATAQAPKASAGVQVELPATPPAVAAVPVASPTEAAATTTAATDEPTKPFPFKAAAQATAPARCEFPSLAKLGAYKLYAAGAYSGRDLSFAIDNSGHQAGRFDVAVNHPGQPVVLMLGSYDPAVWHIGWARGTRIAAVLLSGYHQQFITGLPPEVPVIVSTQEGRGPCGYFYVKPEKAATLNPIARSVFGRPVDMLYPAVDGRVVIGQAVDGIALVTDASARDDAAFRVPDSLAGGELGLNYAISQGWLREARKSDADAWLAAYARVEKVDAPPIAGGQPAGRLRMHNAYVVLKSFPLPPGLYGAHSATFFVPKGVQRPTGELGHSTLYDFNTMTCKGAACGVD